MIKQKHFLQALYKEKKGYANVRRIYCSSKRERGVLLNVLFCIAHGHIPIKKVAFQKLTQSNKRPKLVKIGKTLRQLLKATEEDQIKCLKQFGSLYPYLLQPLFE